MLSIHHLKLSFGSKLLFNDVNLKFLPGNCYGVIGANGAGKSTFLKILAGDIEPSSGEVIIGPGERLAVLKQDQSAFDEYSVLNTVMMGHQELYEVMIEKEAIYSKADFTDEDGIRAADLEERFGAMNGWEAESNASILLNGLGLIESAHHKLMGELEVGEKVRVLLAQALFGNPDILLLDEPTNHLDMTSIRWLEDFIARFENTVIVVSHDRHFLNQVCTHIADVDFHQIQLYVGNYDFWYQSSQLAMSQRRDDGKKREDKIKELKDFIARFSANASKSKQATSRKKLIDKLTIDDIKPSSRRYPFIHFQPERESGDMILEVDHISKTVEGEVLFRDFSLTVKKKEKIAFLSPNDLVIKTLFQVLAGEVEPDHGTVQWGITINHGFFPREHGQYFDSSLTIVDWLRQFSINKEEGFIRGFLGKMLFSGDDGVKPVKVLSGGEKVRCMLSKIMMQGPNALLLDEPLGHLDLESITALNESLIKFPEVVLFSAQDQEFIRTVANRIIEILPGGIIDKSMNFEEYMASEDIMVLRQKYQKS